MRLFFALLDPVCWAVSTHIDKYLFERYFRDSDVTVLVVFTSLTGLLFLPFIWWFKPGIFAPPPGDIAVMAAAGVMYMGAMLFYLNVIQQHEASVVAPFFQLSTIFSLILAYLMLGETLSWHAVAGTALILAGVFAVSAGSLHFGGVKTGLVLAMLACTFILAPVSRFRNSQYLETGTWRISESKGH